MNGSASTQKKEGVSLAELENIKGSGQQGRVRKEDVLDYLKTRGEKKSAPAAASTA